MKQGFQNIIKDLRYLTLFPKRYNTPKGRSRDYWGEVDRKYGNVMKRLTHSIFRWHVIEYNDGHMELAYLRVLKGGIFSGAYPALYRGPLFPHRISIGTFSHIKDIYLAF